MTNEEKKKAVLEWVDGEFRSALGDPERLAVTAAVLAMGVKMGEPPINALKIAIAAFVVTLAKGGQADRDAAAAVRRN